MAGLEEAEDPADVVQGGFVAGEVCREEDVEVEADLRSGGGAVCAGAIGGDARGAGDSFLVEIEDAHPDGIGGDGEVAVGIGDGAEVDDPAVGRGFCLEQKKRFDLVPKNPGNGGEHWFWGGEGSVAD